MRVSEPKQSKVKRLKGDECCQEAEVGDASKVMLDEVQNIKSNILPKMLSDTVYITENRSEEITEINDVNAEVQPIIQVAGVRG